MNQQNIRLALADFKFSIANAYLWLSLASQDIKIRYRRSKLGPFWITLSMAITVYTMGFLYGKLFKINLVEYYPYLASGMICWALISNTIIELTESFVLVERTIKQIKLPLSLHVHRTLARNFIIFFHNLAVIVPIYFVLYAHHVFNLNILFFPLGLLLVYSAGLFYGLLIAILATRYRDLSQIIKSIVQVVFFLTPILWSASILPAKYQLLVKFNPFNALMEVIRAPLMGVAPSFFDLLYVATLTLVGAVLAIVLFSKYRKRIIYWL